MKVIEHIKQKIKEIKSEYERNEHKISYLYGNEISQKEERAYRTGYLRALDHIYCVVEIEELQNVNNRND